MHKILLFMTLIFISEQITAKEIKKKTVPEPTIKNMKYGPHERNVLDFWKADTKKPAPLLFIIHGGGWLGNNKERYVQSRHRNDIDWFLKHGISVAAINYRYSSQAPLPAPVHDAARALQFIRSKAKELGIDKNRIAATGASAGGCTSLWLATHDDLADSKAKDPILRESTRLSAVWVLAAQTTIDPVMIKEWFGEIPVTHPMIHSAAGFKNRQEMEDGYKTKADLYREFSPVNHLDSNDPPMMLTYQGTATEKGNSIHHAIFGIQFKKQAKKAGATCILDLPKEKKLSDKAPNWREFILEQLRKK